MKSLPYSEEADSKAQLAALLGDPWWRLENLYKIVNKEGELVTFRLKPEQKHFLQNRHLRNVILKARQLGFSTVIDLLLLDTAIFNAHTNCGIIAQDIKSSGEIFRSKIETPLEHLPDWLKPAVKIVRRQGGSNGGRIEFEHGSNIIVGTSFRSGTIHFLHVSEHGKICAKYKDKAKELRTGTLPSVPDNGTIYIESTGEGVGGDFYDLCQSAREMHQSGLPLSPVSFRFHFYAWWQNSAYSMPVSELQTSVEQKKYFDDVEHATGTTLSDAQRNWYLHTQRTLKGEMRQEFPSTPDEAFLTSGRRVFSHADILSAQRHLQPPLIVYEVEPQSGRRSRVSAISASDSVLQETLVSLLLVWELPDENEDYAVGADVAEGLEHGDFSSLDIVKKSTGEQVAHWHGHLDATLFASLIAHLGKWYNSAFIMPERNNHGHAVLAYLRDHYPVSRLFTEQYLDRDRQNEETPRLGWNTTRHSKPLLTEGLKELLRDGNSGIKWCGTLAEINSYVYHPNGSMGAQAGCHDDQVMSYMLAQEGRARMPKTIRRKDEPYKAKHWMSY